MKKKSVILFVILLISFSAVGCTEADQVSHNISQEANTRQLALDTSCDVLLHQHTGSLHKELVVCAAGQFEMIIKGDKHEKTDTGTVKRFIGMESVVDVSTE